MKRILKTSMCLALISAMMSGAYAEGTRVSADFQKRSGVPLIKKFGIFNSGIVSMGAYERDFGKMDPLRLDSLRIDLYMGEARFPLGRTVTGTADDMHYDYSKLDFLVKGLEEHGVRPYWSWSYIPTPLQVDNDWRKGPSDIAAWESMFKAFAAHSREAGLRVAYNEVYNEPDCNGVFYQGTWDEYIDLYRGAAKGLEAGDPDAVIGGPSTAFIEATGAASINRFLETVIDENLPLDFFSYHSYGNDKKQYMTRTGLARHALAQYPELDTVELHLNEYNSEIQPFKDGGPAERVRGAASMLTSFERLLDQTDVTLAHWAQFMDTGYEPLGAIATDGRRKAPYWALYMYSQMPEERVAMTGLDGNLYGLASADKTRAAILLWRDEEADERDITVAFEHVPVKRGTLRVYSLDEECDPYFKGGDELTPIAEYDIQSLSQTEMTFSVKAPGILYLQWDAQPVEERAPRPAGKVVRKHYYFPERGKSNYSFYDETDQKVYLGMGDEHSARSIVGVTMSDVADTISVRSVFNGQFAPEDQNAAYTVRVDYETGDGYAKAVLYTFMPENARRYAPMPWGTKRKADEVIVRNELLAGNELIRPRDSAPEDWTGRIILTFDMHSIGPNSRVEALIEGVG